jgi:nitroimidazol reductase NimA-like FMN-containing flavoprotein (pyridoxamine 5'-phosphate oxidase superfamily)
MRKKDQEIIDFDGIKYILTKGLICRLALAVNDVPYIVPMNYGVEFTDPMVLYFHSAPDGRKIEMLDKNNKVCFEIEVETKIVKGKYACDWAMEYKSVIGNGSVEVITVGDEMRHGLDILMRHYAEESEFSYRPKVMQRMLILKLIVESISGKSHSL